MSDDNREAQEMSDEMFQMVRRRYGQNLTKEELEQVQKGVEGIVSAAEAMQAVDLKNGDEPHSVFVPYRKEG